MVLKFWSLILKLLLKLSLINVTKTIANKSPLKQLLIQSLNLYENFGGIK